MKTERKRTLSLNFYDDEILYKDENGIHLKDGVKRMHYDTEQNLDELESHINEIDLAVQKKLKRLEEFNDLEGEVNEY